MHYLYRYSAEMLRDRPFYSSVISEATDSSGVALLQSVQSMTAVSAMGLLSKQAFDMAHTIEPGDPQTRNEVAKIGGIALFTTDVIDDEIDRAEMPTEEKFRYLDSITGTLIDGDPPLHINHYPRGGQAEAVRVSFDLASYIHSTIARYSSAEALTGTFKTLVQDAKDQITSRDITEQLDLAVRVGGGCGAIGAAALTVVEGVDHPEVDKAHWALGAYAECLNHGYEISEDLQEDNINFATLFLNVHGDTKANRRWAKRRLVDTGEQILKEALAELSHPQKNILRAGQRLIDIKYRLLGRLAKPSGGKVAHQLPRALSASDA